MSIGWGCLITVVYLIGAAACYFIGEAVGQANEMKRQRYVPKVEL